MRIVNKITQQIKEFEVNQTHGTPQWLSHPPSKAQRISSLCAKYFWCTHTVQRTSFSESISSVWPIKSIISVDRRLSVMNSKVGETMGKIASPLTLYTSSINLI